MKNSKNKFSLEALILLALTLLPPSVPASTLSGTCKMIEEGDEHSVKIIDATAKLKNNLKSCSKQEQTVFTAFAQKAANDRLGLSPKESEWWTQSILGPLTLKPKNCEKCFYCLDIRL
jgi:hypothetical protein